MANTSTPRSSRYTGLFKNDVDGRVDLYENGNLVSTLNSTLVSLPQALTIGGIAYTFPPDNGDAGEVLQTDGSGVLTWEADAIS